MYSIWIRSESPWYLNVLFLDVQLFILFIACNFKGILTMFLKCDRTIVLFIFRATVSAEKFYFLVTEKIVNILAGFKKFFLIV